MKDLLFALLWSMVMSSFGSATCPQDFTSGALLSVSDLAHCVNNQCEPGLYNGSDYSWICDLNKGVIRRPISSQQILCQDDGTWAKQKHGGTGYCKAVDWAKVPSCPRTFDFWNGQLQDINDTHRCDGEQCLLGDYGNFVCADGFRPIAGRYIFCDADSRWRKGDGLAPCERTCPQDNINNGVVSISAPGRCTDKQCGPGTYYGQSYQWVCNRTNAGTFKRPPSVQRLKCENGIWKKEITKHGYCNSFTDWKKVKTCRRIFNFANGQVENVMDPYRCNWKWCLMGYYKNVTCAYGFAHIAGRYIHCSDGTWKAGNGLDPCKAIPTVATTAQATTTPRTTTLAKTTTTALTTETAKTIKPAKTSKPSKTTKTEKPNVNAPTTILAPQPTSPQNHSSISPNSPRNTFPNFPTITDEDQNEEESSSRAASSVIAVAFAAMFSFIY